MIQSDSSFSLLRPPDSIFEFHTQYEFNQSLQLDSILAPYTDLLPPERESMFATQSLSQESPMPITRPSPLNSQWIFIAALSLLVITSIYLNIHKFKIKDILASLFDRRVLFRVMRDYNIKNFTLLPIVLVYFASVALIPFSLSVFSTDLPLFRSEWITYIALLLALFLFFFVKNWCIRLLGLVFDEKILASLYVTNSYFFAFLGGLISIPCIIFMSPSSLFASLATFIFIIAIAILFIVRFIRGLQLIFTTSGRSKLYLIYYLCTFEVVPILIAIKVLIL